MQSQQQMTVPLDRLVRDDAANVRKKYGADAIEEMKASILAHGIIQPIAARPPQAGDADLGGQLYRIFAGGRRWVAMGELVKEGKIASDYDVPIIISDVDDSTATEMSLAENLIREQMTPTDEFRAFAKLADSGQSAADIALHFGQTERYVKGRLALASLHPEILAAFEEGKINYAAACAYTLNPDPEIQVKFFREAGYQRDSEWAIKAAMRRAGVRADSPLADFIGEEAYLAAGGIITEDLFGDEVMWTSGELIESLKAGALERHRAEAVAEGWSFLATTDELGVNNLWQLRELEPEGDGLTEDEQKRMDEVAALLENFEGGDPEIGEEEAEKLNAEYEAFSERENTFTADQKAQSGIVIDMQSLNIRIGCLRPEAGSSGGGGGVGVDDAPLAKAAKAQKDPLALTQPLKDKIGETATAALKAAVAADPHRALALVAAMLEHSDGSTTSGECRPSRLHVERVDFAYGSIEAKKRSIKKAFDAYEAMELGTLLAAVATLATQSVDLTEKWLMKQSYNADAPRDKTRSDFLTAFAADPKAVFDADAWFTACTKPMIDAAMKEMTGFSATKPKKADMAREAAEKARETGWLPKPLRLAGYVLKGKKPAGAKKSAAKKAAGKSKEKAAA